MPAGHSGHVGSLRPEPSSPGAGGQAARPVPGSWVGRWLCVSCLLSCLLHCPGQEDPSSHATALRPRLPGYCLLPTPFLPSCSPGLAPEPTALLPAGEGALGTWEGLLLHWETQISYTCLGGF